MIGTEPRTASSDLVWGKHRLAFGTRPLIMGVLNVTPDSFSDGGSFFSTRDAVSQAEKMVREGADIIDIGGESTRPFSETVSETEEIRRVIPVVEALAHHVKIPISIDTTKAAVAGHALNAGASIINDISALRADPALAEVAAASSVPIILMHMKGTPGNMQISPTYDDLFGEIYAFLEQAVATAKEKGIQRSKIIIDPGIGFGKTVRHNLLLLKYLTNFKTMGLPVLIGPSRKAFVRKLLKPDHLTDIDPQLPIVETGTQAAVAIAALNGADIVRVHNVAGTLATLKIVAATQAAKPE
ncbi:MAG TPA: dihydropteroate synthase [Desulfobacteraceae bacterium]|nr:dihydropteroate synthase [Desulfobacteraceae bacterium]